MSTLLGCRRPAFALSGASWAEGFSTRLSASRRRPTGSGERLLQVIWLACLTGGAGSPVSPRAFR
jgi:hypothetical protein